MDSSRWNRQDISVRFHGKKFRFFSSLLGLWMRAWMNPDSRALSPISDRLASGVRSSFRRSTPPRARFECLFVYFCSCMSSGIKVRNDISTIFLFFFFFFLTCVPSAPAQKMDLHVKKICSLLIIIPKICEAYYYIHDSMNLQIIMIFCSILFSDSCTYPAVTLMLRIMTVTRYEDRCNEDGLIWQNLWYLKRIHKKHKKRKKNIDHHRPELWLNVTIVSRRWQWFIATKDHWESFLPHLIPILWLLLSRWMKMTVGAELLEIGTLILVTEAIKNQLRVGVRAQQ